jgi:putative endonuclease
MAAMAGRFVHAVAKALDQGAALLGRGDARAAHLATGARGEEAAYFHLRKMGYTMVARNWRSPRRKGEIDLIGYDGEVLCFIEVKTRTTRAVAPAEAAVDENKKRDVMAVADEYVRRVKTNPAVRLDVVSVYFERGETEITVFKGAF